MTIDTNDILNSIMESLSHIDHIRAEEIPNINLYMDQVTGYINEIFAPIAPQEQQITLTKAMVNNYVKLGLIPKPNKKKYSRRHLAYLVVILLMKELFPIAQIRTAIQMQTAREGSGSKAYDLFCTETEHALAAACAEMLGKPAPSAPPSGPDGRLLRMAARAFACRAAAAQEAALEALPAEAE